MKIVVGLPGVTSATLEGADQNQIVVIGEGVDSVQLTTRLRKKMGFTELVSVSEVEEKKGDANEKPGSDPVVLPTAWAYQYGGPHYVAYYAPEPYQDNCNIM
ncbi:hypothetical protein ACLOJK_041619 [Asimina triloba]